MLLSTAALHHVAMLTLAFTLPVGLISDSLVVPFPAQEPAPFEIQGLMLQCEKVRLDGPEIVAEDVVLRSREIPELLVFAESMRATVTSDRVVLERPAFTWIDGDSEDGEADRRVQRLRASRVDSEVRAAETQQWLFARRAVLSRDGHTLRAESLEHRGFQAQSAEVDLRAFSARLERVSTVFTPKDIERSVTIERATVHRDLKTPSVLILEGETIELAGPERIRARRVEGTFDTSGQLVSRAQLHDAVLERGDVRLRADQLELEVFSPKPDAPKPDAPKPEKSDGR